MTPCIILHYLSVPFISLITLCSKSPRRRPRYCSCCYSRSQKSCSSNIRLRPSPLVSPCLPPSAGKKIWSGITIVNFTAIQTRAGCSSLLIGAVNLPKCSSSRDAFAASGEVHFASTPFCAFSSCFNIPSQLSLCYPRYWPSSWPSSWHFGHICMSARVTCLRGHHLPWSPTFTLRPKNLCLCTRRFSHVR